LKNKIKNTSKSKKRGLYANSHYKYNQEYVDYDYVKKLSDDEAEWLSNFSDNYYGARFKSDDDLNPIKNRTLSYAQSRHRRRDIMSIRYLSRVDNEKRSPDCVDLNAMLTTKLFDNVPIVIKKREAMKVSMLIKAPPFSINSAYYLKSYGKGSTTKIRTKECRDWGDSVLMQLQAYRSEIANFVKAFDETKDAISVKLVFNIPVKSFLTQKNMISLRSNDLSNVEKLLIDIIFDERFNNRSLNGLDMFNFNINDKLIVNLNSTKQPTVNDYYIEVDVRAEKDYYDRIQTYLTEQAQVSNEQG
jgi:hypothetical protein